MLKKNQYKCMQWIESDRRSYPWITQHVLKESVQAHAWIGLDQRSHPWADIVYCSTSACMYKTDWTGTALGSMAHTASCRSTGMDQIRDRIGIDMPIIYVRLA
jgi:hypothetical protein